MGFDSKIIDSGMYRAEVKKAAVVTNKYCVSKYNPEGICLTLWLDTEDDEGEFKRLFTDLSSVSRVNDFLGNIGEKPVKSFDDIKVKNIEGKSVFIEVDQYTSKAGKLSNIVKGFAYSELPVAKSDSGDPTF